MFIRKFGWGFLQKHPKRAHIDTNWCCPVEYSAHRNTKNVKYRIQIFEPNEPNVFPKDIIEKWLDQKKKEEEERRSRVIMPPLSYNELSKPLPCISFLEGFEFVNINDGRKRAIWIMISHYKKKLGKEDLVTKIINYSHQLGDN